ncbi:hypothetical protein [Chelatococcus reniformis]|uniref:Uncharacterized protein n=1 Tax=Chelatococcus reniformis TaxID=1494448 RepID=A0A916U1A0_9HYPH|nr:hypothetical protein [Chelatococcus reniformis]GGC52534.1 hypothetical protein GCM10010994_09510 [Chelatococcus reniformis]
MRVLKAWVFAGALAAVAASSGSGMAAKLEKPEKPTQAAASETGERDIEAFIARNKALKDAEERSFQKRDAELKRKVNGICSNC